MTNQGPNPILDRLFRHMAWANQSLLATLKEIPTEALELFSGNPDWRVATIVEHYVRSAGSYAARVSGDPFPTDIVRLATTAELDELARCCAEFDERLRVLATEPEGMTTYIREGRTIVRARSTILGQSIHHATEHRAQIADILTFHGIKVLDLDELVVWAYSDFEGLGA